MGRDSNRRRNKEALSVMLEEYLWVPKRQAGCLCEGIMEQLFFSVTLNGHDDETKGSPSRGSGKWACGDA